MSELKKSGKIGARLFLHIVYSLFQALALAILLAIMIPSPVMSRRIHPGMLLPLYDRRVISMPMAWMYTFFAMIFPFENVRKTTSTHFIKPGRIMKYLAILTILLIGASYKIQAQPGFNRIYDSAQIGNNSFFNIFVDEDTIIAVGIGYIPGSLQGINLAKMDSSGNLVQLKFYADSVNTLSTSYYHGDIIKTSKGNYMFSSVAFGRAAYQTVQINRNLEVLSVFEHYSPDDWSLFDQGIVELRDSGFLIAGNVQRKNYKLDGFIRRIDKNGQLLWFKYYGDYNRDEGFYCIHQINENRYLLGGSAGPDMGNGETNRYGLWVIDSNGVVLDTVLGPHSPNVIVLRGLLPASDGGFVAHGRSYLGEGPWGSRVQITLLKFNAELELEWMRFIGPNTSNYNGIYDMIQTPDGHYLVAGQRTAYGNPPPPGADWGGWLYKFSEQGDSLWARVDRAPPPYVSTGQFFYGGVGVLSSGSVIAGGEGDVSDHFVGWVVKVSADGCMDTLDCIPVSDTEAPTIIGGEGLRIWPNPAGNRVSYDYAGAGKCVGVLLTDMASGNVVLQQRSAGSAGSLDLTAVSAGMYVLVLQLEDGRILRRKVLVWE